MVRTKNQKTMKTKQISIGILLAGLIFLVACGGGQGDHATGADYKSYGNEDVAYVTEEEFTEGADDAIFEEPYLESEEVNATSFNTESYDYLPENDFLSPKANPLSTF